MYENGTADEFRDNFDRIYAPVAARTVPTPGNQHWPNHAEGYDPYWRRVLRRPMRSYDGFAWPDGRYLAQRRGGP